MSWLKGLFGIKENNSALAAELAEIRKGHSMLEKDAVELEAETAANNHAAKERNDAIRALELTRLRHEGALNNLETSLKAEYESAQNVRRVMSDTYAYLSASQKVKAMLKAEHKNGYGAAAAPIVQEKSETTSEEKSVKKLSEEEKATRKAEADKVKANAEQKAKAEEKAKFDKLVANIKVIVPSFSEAQAIVVASWSVADLISNAKTFQQVGQFEFLEDVWAAGAWKWGAPSKEFKALKANFIAKAAATTPSAPSSDDLDSGNANNAPGRPGVETPTKETGDAAPPVTEVF